MATPAIGLCQFRAWDNGASGNGPTKAQPPVTAVDAAGQGVIGLPARGGVFPYTSLVSSKRPLPSLPPGSSQLLWPAVLVISYPTLSATRWMGRTVRLANPVLVL